MLPQVFIFNPDSDMALANGGTNYLSPRFAEQLTRDLQLLPAWLAPARAPGPGPRGARLHILAHRPAAGQRQACRQQLQVAREALGEARL